MSSAADPNRQLHDASDEVRNEADGIGFIDGFEFIGDQNAQLSNNDNFNLHARSHENTMLGHAADMENYESGLAMDEQYYVMDEGIMPGMMNLSGGRFVLNTELGNISVTRSDLVSVGVDVSDPANINVTVPQSDALMQLCQDRGDIIEPDYSEYTMCAQDGIFPKAELSDQQERFFPNETPGPSGVQEGSGAGSASVKEEDIYAYITECGDLSLIGRNGRVVATYSRSELASVGVSDVAALSESDLQDLIQSLQRPSDFAETQPAQLQYVDLAPPVLRKAVAPPLLPPKSLVGADGSLGRVVEVLKNGSTQPKQAVIRYSRNNGTYKVQFEDGHFEWVTEQNIVQKDENKPKPLVPVQKAESRRKQTLTVDPSDYQAGGPVEKPTLIHADNGYCALCDRRIPSARPAFIVIRIPACRCCAESRALLLEDVHHTLLTPTPAPKQPPEPEEDPQPNRKRTRNSESGSRRSSESNTLLMMHEVRRENKADLLKRIKVAADNGALGRNGTETRSDSARNPTQAALDQELG